MVYRSVALDAAQEAGITKLVASTTDARLDMLSGSMMGLGVGFSKGGKRD